MTWSPTPEAQRVRSRALGNASSMRRLVAVFVAVFVVAAAALAITTQVSHAKTRVASSLVEQPATTATDPQSSAAVSPDTTVASGPAARTPKLAGRNRRAAARSASSTTTTDLSADSVNSAESRTQILSVSTATGVRTALVHTPATGLGRSLPLLVALHGSSSSGAALASVTGFDDLADSNGFIVVYPDGELIGGERSWNSGQCCEPATSAQVDDIGFLNALLDEVLATYPIDPARVYVTGHSNGAIMAQEVACRMADRVAAIASVSGALDANESCAPVRPIAMLEVHGTADENVLYEYGQDAVSAWRRLDGCTTTSIDATVGAFDLSTWSHCADSTVVELATIEGGPHDWPTDGAQLVWSFLSVHRLTDF
jgi:polyhydroxybutyrate depolymerase